MHRLEAVIEFNAGTSGTLDLAEWVIGEQLLFRLPNGGTTITPGITLALNGLVSYDGSGSVGSNN